MRVWTSWSLVGCGLALVWSACGGGGGEECTPHDRTVCAEEEVYWVDSCGERGEVAERCQCGCNADYTGCAECACQPDCSGRECGADGCGGECPPGCDAGESCEAGQCQPGCQPDCSGRECGADGCGGECPPGCDAGESCEAGQCQPGCQPDCSGRECGADGCGGECPPGCDAGESCDQQGQCQPGGSDGLLSIDCDVPYVLDASRITDMNYMTMHFEHLVQQYCISGTVGGIDVTGFPEKMYYGQHDQASTLSLVQTSMSDGLSPQYSVKLDFVPDSDVVADAVWTVGVGIEDQEAIVGLIRYEGQNSMCLYALGQSGQLTFSQAVDCDQIEGGSFSLQGNAMLINPWDVADFCSQTPANLPCCNR